MRRLAPVVLVFLFFVPVAGAWTWPVQGPVLETFSFDPAHPYGAGQQQTALVLLLKGHPAEGAPAALTIAFEDSTVLDITLTPEQRSALANGGIAELHHGFIEPREQVMELSVARGTAAELAERFAAPPKGEITLVLGPGRREVDETGALAAVAELVESGVPRKRAAEVVARLTGVARNRLYRGSL